MVAPALVMVTPGSVDSTVRRIVEQMRSDLRYMRPGLTVECVLLGDSSPSPKMVAQKLIKEGITEIVYVPLCLTNAITPWPAVDDLVHHSNQTISGANFVTSRPLGPEISMLNVLDERLRTSLANARVLELDGLVLSASSAGDVRGAALLARRARQWSAHHRLPCLTAAADGTGPNVATAISALRAQGRRHIAVGSLFLAADESYLAQTALAMRSGAVAVSDPVGGSEEVLDLVLARYAFAAMELLDFEPVAAKPKLTVVSA